MVYRRVKARKNQRKGRKGDINSEKHNHTNNHNWTYSPFIHSIVQGGHSSDKEGGKDERRKNDVKKIGDKGNNIKDEIGLSMRTHAGVLKVIKRQVGEKKKPAERQRRSPRLGDSTNQVDERWTEMD